MNAYDNLVHNSLERRSQEGHYEDGSLTSTRRSHLPEQVVSSQNRIVFEFLSSDIMLRALLLYTRLELGMNKIYFRFWL